MSLIDLRVSNVSPPSPDAKRTIYRDIVNLPDPVKLGITVRMFNYDSITLYFQMTGSGTGYTFGTVNIGAVGTGANIYRNLDEFGSRAKPAAETTETITLTLKAYSDAGYTNLVWTFNREVTVVFIKSNDPSYTVDVSNNFDDGTVQGWAASNDLNNDPGYPTATIQIDYVLSPPYSLRMTSQRTNAGGNIEVRSRLYKAFTTPNKDIAYAIFDLRISTYPAGWGNGIKNVSIRQDAVAKIYLGRPYDTADADYVPIAKWIRCIIPLPKNVSVTLDIFEDVFLRWYGTNYWYIWLDDFKIISK